ncbi:MULTISPECIES: FHA domain-containing protein [unclassified Variovorax]|uniref:FHA domain-containing protein n=1 Tax=Variovorax TaxID=34072 RepID=UPI000B88B041|nr:MULTISPECIES: FHA domain-containing protein [unclassified Variovorax]TAJ68046.1 MAG: FHA domain-containing protein [Variovorax sp.]
MPRMSISIDGVVIREVTLAKDRTTLGRRAYNDIVVDNLAVSGEHAVLTLRGGDVQIEDLNSTNGTYVNAVAVQKRTLKDNDVIEVGGCRIHYRARSVAPAAGTPVQVVVGTESSAPIPLSAAPTESGALVELGVPVLRVLAGENAGHDLPLQKVVTTVGKPGVAVAVVTRRRQGYVAASVMGAVLLNGEPLGVEAVALHERDLLELGTLRLQFARV